MHRAPALTRSAATIGHTPLPSLNAPVMTVLLPMPASIARRVRSGRVSIDWRRSARAWSRDVVIRWLSPFVGARPPYGSSSPGTTESLVVKGILQDQSRMKLGVHIGYWGLGLSSDDQRAIVQEAERLGYDSDWAAAAARSGGRRGGK